MLKKENALWKSLRLVPCLALVAVVLFGAASLEARSPKITNENTGEVYTDLQTAITAASSGDTLEIKGTCVGSFVIAKNLILKGTDDAILDGAGAGTPLTVMTNPISTVEITVTAAGLTIQNGLSTNLGGGGVLNVGAHLVLKNSRIRNNNALLGNGGGIMNLTTSPSSFIASLSLIDCEVTDNSTQEAGGGIANVGGILDMYETNVTKNFAQQIGGGIASIQGSNSITKCKINQNVAILAGGGIADFLASLTTLSRVVVKNNTAALGGGIYNGAAIPGTLAAPGPGSTLIALRSNINDNIAYFEGGGLFNEATATATLNHSKVNRNEALTAGGGIFNNTGAFLNLSNTEVKKNTPDNIVDL